MRKRWNFWKEERSNIAQEFLVLIKNSSYNSNDTAVVNVAQPNASKKIVYNSNVEFIPFSTTHILV